MTVPSTNEAGFVADFPHPRSLSPNGGEGNPPTVPPCTRGDQRGVVNSFAPTGGEGGPPGGGPGKGERFDENAKGNFTLFALIRLFLFVLWASTLSAQSTVEVCKVISKTVERQVRLPGEFLPYLSVELHAKVVGFVEKVTVDRGSLVKAGQLLVSLSAPEVVAQLAEAQSKAQAIESQRAEAQAKLAAVDSTYERLKDASATPGVVAGNELVQAEKAVDAARASLRALEDSAKAARASAASVRELESYLKIAAPFSGVITERYVHPGALVGPGGRPNPLLKLEQNSRLRLAVAVPESEVAGIVKGARLPFTVSTFPGETFYGRIARVAHSLDIKTRTMTVELDVQNPSLQLAPGMYAEVLWMVRRARPSFLVPPSSIVTTTERTFVIRVRGGHAEYVDIRRGAPVADLVEVFAALSPGDEILKRGSDEVREGSAVVIQRTGQQ